MPTYYTRGAQLLSRDSQIHIVPLGDQCDSNVTSNQPTLALRRMIYHQHEVHFITMALLILTYSAQGHSSTICSRMSNNLYNQPTSTTSSNTVVGMSLPLRKNKSTTCSLLLVIYLRDWVHSCRLQQCGACTKTSAASRPTMERPI